MATFVGEQDYTVKVRFYVEGVESLEEALEKVNRGEICDLDYLMDTAEPMGEDDCLKLRPENSDMDDWTYARDIGAEAKQREARQQIRRRRE